MGSQDFWEKMALGGHSCVHPTDDAAGEGEAISVVWVFVFVTRPGVGFSGAVSLKPFKTQLKVELLFLEGIGRMPLEGLEVQE